MLKLAFARSAVDFTVALKRCAGTAYPRSNDLAKPVSCSIRARLVTPSIFASVLCGVLLVK